MPVAGFPAEWELSAFLNEVPVSSREDLLRLFPRWFRDTDSTVRDAMVDALMFAAVRKASDLAAFAASVNEAYAVGSELDLLGGKNVRAFDESDEAYRARLLADDSDPSPAKILDAIEAILAPFTAKKPYYFERPDDEIFLFSSSDTRDRGFYLNGARPIRNAKRRYDVRTRCEPLHGFIWDHKRHSAELFSTSLTPPYVTEIVGDDTTAADNAFGMCVVAIPAVRPPGSRRKTDAMVFADPTAGGTVSLLAASGYLTSAAADAGDRMSVLLSEASAEARLGGNRPSGSALYASDHDLATVASQIQALLRSRAMYPVQFKLLLDPAI